MVKVKEDLTGKKFGRLTVLEQAEDYVCSSGEHKPVWLCKCDCGNYINVSGSSLKSGHTKSCGCFKKEATSINMSKKNIYKFYDNYGICYDDKYNKFYFDLEDYDKIKDIYWSANHDGYACHRNNDNTTIRMHRLIMNCPKDLFVDHINHNINDNRKSNLRIVTNTQNGYNRKNLRNNTSGVTGVHWSNDKHGWIAQIVYNKKQIYLGKYNNFDDAVKARKEAEEKYFGEYSYDNSMNKGENK